MSQKTTSSTAIVGDWTYILLNRPTTTWIDYIRFKQPSAPQQGKIGISSTLISSPEGPIDTLVFKSTSGNRELRLYYIGDKGGKKQVSEVKLDNAQADATDPKTQWTAQASDLKFEQQISGNTRLADETSFLAASIKADKPVVVWKAAGENFIQYANFDGTSWNTVQLALPTATT